MLFSPFAFLGRGTKRGQPPVADALSALRSAEKEQSVHEGQLRLLKLRNWGEPLFWGRSARKMIRWIIFSGGRAAALEGKSGSPQQCFL